MPSAVGELSPGQANLVIGAESWTPGSGLLLYAPIDAMLDAADRAAVAGLATSPRLPRLDTAGVPRPSSGTAVGEPARSRRRLCRGVPPAR